ncbi:ParB-like nuclease domain-containing protein [Enterococcus faecalis]|nr:ParB-like nuclease domain-containing protein [Enterococcus faecalis]
MGKSEEKYVSPVYNVKKIPIGKIKANAYNPNRVAMAELKLLEQSIKIDGYTMPIVCFYVKEQDYYEIVDGYHRYLVMKYSEEISKREEEHLPVVVIDQPIEKRIASTIRHNRARGTHKIDSMVEIVQQLVEAGLSNQWIMKNLGMDQEELLRLKQISGLAALFSQKEFSEGWEEV